MTVLMTQLPVNFAPVRDSGYIDGVSFVVDGVDNGLSNGSRNREVFWQPEGPGLLASSHNLGPDASDHIRRQVTKLPFRRGSEGNGIDRHLILPSARNSA